MSKFKLTLSLLAALLVGGLGGSLAVASSGERRCQVVLEGGGTVTVSVWGACSVGNVQGLVDRPVLSVADVTPPAPAEQPSAESTPSVPTPSHDDRAETPTTPAETTTAPRLPVERTDTLVPRDELEGVDGEDGKDEEGEESQDQDEDESVEGRPGSDEASPPPVPSPAFSFSIPGPIQVGIPNSSIDSFGIPPFLLAIYQAAGSEYGVPWSVLAAINEVETGYGRNLNVSSAGALGWMQFIPSSWATYGVDANGDGLKDPYNPVDAIFAAARYLRAAGAQEDLARAVFAYNHADWYVDLVLSRARQIDELPDDLVTALTGLAQGRFPVAGGGSYASGAASTARSLAIRSRDGAAVVAVNDGVITRVGRDPRLGRFVELRDIYGNLYTYGGLARIATTYPAPKPRAVSEAAVRAELKLPGAGPKPTAPASAGRQLRRPGPDGERTASSLPKPGSVDQLSLRAPVPGRPLGNGKPVAGYPSLDVYSREILDLRAQDVVLRQLRPGAQVISGTVLGRIEGRSGRARLSFGVRPAGEGSPAIDPKPVLDGWRKLQSVGGQAVASSALQRGPVPAAGGQVLLLGKDSLARRVLADPRVEIYDCGRRDIQAGQVDRRVLAAIEFLASSGLRPTITSLRCGHSYYTKSGGVSDHSSGNAVDIAAINGVPILGNQGPGSITEQAIRRLLALQGSMKPHQIISLMTFDQADNTISMSDHADHIHVGFEPPSAGGGGARGTVSVLGPDQWTRVTARMNEIYNPVEEAEAAPPAGRVPARVPRLKAPAAPQAAEVERMLEGGGAAGADEGTGGGDGEGDESGDQDGQDQASNRQSAGADDEPTLEVRPERVRKGEELTIEGRGWECPDGSPPDQVELELVSENDPLAAVELATVEVDDDGHFRKKLRLTGGLLPDDVDLPEPFVITATACNRTIRSETFRILEREGDDGDDSGDDGATDGNQRSSTSSSEGDADDDAEEGSLPSEESDGSFPDDSGGGGDEGDSTVLGASDASDDDDGDDDGDDDNDGKRNKDRDGDGGDGDDGDDDNDAGGGGGGGKDGKLGLPKAAPALASTPPALPSDTAAIPSIDGFGLGDVLFVILCLLGLALVAALAYAGRMLGLRDPAVDSQAPTQVLRPLDRRVVGPGGGPS